VTMRGHKHEFPLNDYLDNFYRKVHGM
jgi:hypothetical protein